MSRGKSQPWIHGLVRGLEGIQIFRKKGIFTDLRKVNQRELEMDVTARGGSPWLGYRKKEAWDACGFAYDWKENTVREMNHWKLLADLAPGYRRFCSLVQLTHESGWPVLKVVDVKEFCSESWDSFCLWVCWWCNYCQASFVEILTVRLLKAATFLINS